MAARATALVILIALFGLTACGPGNSTYGSKTHATAKATATGLEVESSDLGPIVTSSDGRTVYAFDKDTKGTTASACTGSCRTQWPPVWVTTDLKGQGIRAAVGTIDSTDGKKQATLNGWPLYFYAGDSGIGDVNGQGVGGTWWVLDASGNKVTRSAPATSGSTGYGY